jgi:hypothetical protein
MKIGDQVVPSGMGKTSNWKFQLGTITRRSGKKIYVQWDDTILEDEMKSYEIQLFNPNLLLEFSDGLKIYTGGIFRILLEYDGNYVVGGGRLIPVQTRKDGIIIISELKKKEREEKKKVLSLFNQKYEVSLKELVLLNLVSIENGYNRNLIKDFHNNFQKSNCFELSPFMLHQYKNGELCEPHIRYMISSIGNTNSVLIGLLDLPAVTIPTLLSLKIS